ncbi:hypothetical protein BO94DRAFT_126027 [Aspergillus sclerotioniger CBS 115572]|uniref:Uncharacterized protein n=1 Tax=Aspergillus sclerotioniger CBS 115572 TaxID=1450535 RepID=A0A317XAP1_9EURO|nr:hypothetical protein BO94DRAFT_126027 [Aspergillus sclerotioniger CBS 115572]PWY95465.1 hypothetical protein BO94DRAFT_126027 [Aspergillus sclerotioniger CBS 115572]
MKLWQQHVKITTIPWATGGIPMFLVGGSRGKNSLSVLPAPSTKGGARGKKGPTGNETSHYPTTSGAGWNIASLGNVELVSCLLGTQRMAHIVKRARYWSDKLKNTIDSSSSFLCGGDKFISGYFLIKYSITRSEKGVQYEIYNLQHNSPLSINPQYISKLGR